MCMMSNRCGKMITDFIEKEVPGNTLEGSPYPHSNFFTIFLCAMSSVCSSAYQSIRYSRGCFPASLPSFIMCFSCADLYSVACIVYFIVSE